MLALVVFCRKMFAYHVPALFLAEPLSEGIEPGLAYLTVYSGEPRCTVLNELDTYVVTCYRCVAGLFTAPMDFQAFPADRQSLPV